MFQKSFIEEKFVNFLPNDLRKREGLGLMNLEKKLSGLVQTARQSWPDVVLSPEDFFPEVAKRLEAEDDLFEALEKLRISDLYLACACLRGDERAVAEFLSRCIPGIRSVLKRFPILQDQEEDILQLVYLRVFIGSENRKALINSYAARGDLRNWLKTVAVRTAQNFLRKDLREQAVEISQIECMSESIDPEMLYIKRMYHREFNLAFLNALSKLNSKERKLLRYHLIYRKTLQEIASVYLVNRNTITRWISNIREKLLAETRRALTAQLGSRNRELDSLIGALRGQLDVSVRRFIA